MAAQSGWNAGAAGASSFLSTLQGLTALENAQMQNEKARRDMEQEAALDRAWKESQARVGQQDEYGQAIRTGAGMTPAGTQQAQMLSQQGALPGNTPEDQAFERASAQSAAGAMRENAVAQGAIPVAKAALPEMAPTEYTQRQALKEFGKAAAGISRKGTIEAMQLKSIIQQAETEDKFFEKKQQLDDKLSMIHGTAETSGLKGLYEKGKENGLKLNFVEGKNGVGSRIQVLGPKGDVLEVVSDVNTAVKKLSDAVMQQFSTEAVSLLGSPDKVLAYMQGERKIGIEERGVAVKEAVAPSEIAKNTGAANYYNAGGRAAGGGGGTTERILAKADELAKDKTSKFYGKKEDAYEFLKRGAVKNDDALTWNDIEKKLRGDGASPQDIAIQRQGFFGPERGYAPPAAVALLQKGVDPKTGNVLTEKQLQEFNRKFPKTPWQDILGEDNMPKPPPVTQTGGIPVPR
jgi:hypothetical protein